MDKKISGWCIEILRAINEFWAVSNPRPLDPYAHILKDNTSIRQAIYEVLCIYDSER